MTRLFYLHAGLSELPGGVGWLSDAERETARSLQITKRRLDWLLGRYVAKSALAAYSGTRDAPLARWEIRAARDGAPQAWSDGHLLDLAISLSHSGSRALCVIAPDGIAPGCDIERVEVRGPAFTETFFTHREQRLVTAADETSRSLVVTLLWSAKESALKSLRHGLRKDTRCVDVRVDLTDHTGGWRPFLVEADESAAPLPGWWRTDTGFVLTVAADRPTGAPQRLENGMAPLVSPEAHTGI